MTQAMEGAHGVPRRKYDRLAQQVAILERLLDDRSRELFRLTSSLELYNQYLSTILSEIADALLVVNAEGIVVMANRTTGRMLDSTEQATVGRQICEFLALNGMPVGKSMLPRMVGNEIELELLRPDGRSVDLLCSASVLEAGGGLDEVGLFGNRLLAGLPEGRCYIVLGRDVSERKHAMEKIQSLARLVEENPSVVMRISSDCVLLYVNPAGRAFAQDHGCRLGDRVSDKLAAIVHDVMRSGRRLECEEEALGRTWGMIYAPIRGQKYVNVYGIDITERVIAEQQLLHNAFYDELTDLPNRALLRDHIERALLLQERDPEHQFALLEVNLDRFRYINETFGHEIGDLLLQACAQRLQGNFRGRDTIARFSADTFCVLQERVEGLNAILATVRRLTESFSEPFIIDEHELFVSVSVGIALSSGGSASAEELLRDTDTALYRAKSSGRGNYAVFDTSMQDRMRRQLSLEGRLRKAIRNDRFLLHYQPKVATDSGALCGFEALVRWPDGDNGLISPAEFIAVAEDTGLIIPLGEWISSAVCQQLKYWQEEVVQPVPVAINISGKQFEHPEFIANFRGILEATGVPPALIQVEITESSLMGELWNVIKRLGRLRDMGIVSAIDDFGTGYSSLAYLKQFPVRYLKVDRAFIKDMHQNPDDYTITSAIVAMAHQLGMRVIAEGVENRQQVDMLQALGCEEIQGFYFSKPVPAATALQIMRDGRI